MMICANILPPTEAAISPSNRPHHPHSLFPRHEIVIHIRWEFQPIQMPTNQSICIILRISWEYLPIASTSPIVLQHRRIAIIQSTMEGRSSVKTKVGIFFGYNGEKFQGIQYQRDTENTIENILHRVLCNGGFILKTNMESLRRIKWSRAARTDKRVHALCNGVSASLELDERYILDRAKRDFDLEKVIKDINAELPYDIRILAMKKVGKGFDMRHDACTRVYNYIAPLKLFLSKEQFESGYVLDQIGKEELLVKLNQLAAKYVGTHHYHNFTKGYKMDDPRCDRYVLSVTAEHVEPEVIQKYLEEEFPTEEERKLHRMSFIRFTLVGQSFIYHQIRKMIGLLIKICYQQLDGEPTIKLAFQNGRYDVYLAPGQGLYLNRMTFDAYNKKKQPQLRVILNEEEERRIVSYRAYLQSKILSHEVKEEVFTKWLVNHNNQAVEEEEEEEISVNND